ncbi:TetR family transcriptional regulator [Rhodococcus sp. NPDC127530]|uniref:TetR family transcriptional regulator n=1 Tax=unclassified Rhodococcus (in: high G+C Gram-positive bacteria) TaxID=192944 RepID=UPI0036347C67
MIVIQQRSRGTRNSVLQRAAEEFDRHGYVRTTLEMIIGQSGVGKGAVYHHFSSKPDLAGAVISEGMNRMDHLRTQQMRRHTRAVEALIELSYTLADMGRGEAMVRAAFRLVREMGDSSGRFHTATSTIHTWTETYRGLVERAIAEGDIRADLDPGEVAEVLVAVAYGAQLHATATGILDAGARQVDESWRVLLPALTTPVDGTYFLRFAQRRTPVATPTGDTPGGS